MASPSRKRKAENESTQDGENISGRILAAIFSVYVDEPTERASKRPRAHAQVADTAAAAAGTRFLCPHPKCPSAAFGSASSFMRHLAGHEPNKLVDEAGGVESIVVRARKVAATIGGARATRAPLSPLSQQPSRSRAVLLRTESRGMGAKPATARERIAALRTESEGNRFVTNDQL